jgi:hypothetical protein
MGPYHFIVSTILSRKAGGTVKPPAEPVPTPAAFWICLSCLNCLQDLRGPRGHVELRRCAGTVEDPVVGGLVLVVVVEFSAAGRRRGGRPAVRGRARLVPLLPLDLGLEPVEVGLEAVVLLLLLAGQLAVLAGGVVHDLLHLVPDVGPLLAELQGGGHAGFLS